MDAIASACRGRGRCWSGRRSPGPIDGIIWGTVILPAGAPNVAREIALDLKSPAPASKA
jgi:acetyl-CoA acyltransferase